MDIDARLNGLGWDEIAVALDRRGWATTGPLLAADERRELIAAYGDDGLFRSTVVMARHGYGRGEYRYFAYPLPELVQILRERLYRELLPVANRWRTALGQGGPFPESYVEFLARAMRRSRSARLRSCSATGRAITIAFTRTSTATGCFRSRQRSC